jgi:peptidoglycan-N-acetylmuramic acid deacetylase
MKNISKVLSLIFISLNIFAFNTNAEDFDSKEYDWYFHSDVKGQTPSSPKETAKFNSKYSTYYLGNTQEKVIYLTFDQGYENGNTLKILDILKEEQVPAAFFVVRPYLKDYPDIVKRMVEEGHIVGNHSSHHPSMASIRDEKKFEKEFKDVEELFSEITGKEMPKYFRPPMGKYSELSLARTEKLGYKTIFWSFAYRDWIQEKQPSENFAIKKITEGFHPGEIMLLHSVSKTNTEVLKTIIKEAKNQGYTFKSLAEL